MKPLDKLISSLAKQNIVFFDTDGEMNNVIFIKGEKIVKIAHRMFYRQSGICVIHKDGVEKNSIELVYVDDEMFYGSYMKSILDVHFK